MAADILAHPACTAEDALSRLTLLEWILAARNIVDNLDAAIKHEPALADVLRRWDIRLPSAAWNNAEENALGMLTCDLRAAIRAIQQGVDNAQST